MQLLLAETWDLETPPVGDATTEELLVIINQQHLVIKAVLEDLAAIKAEIEVHHGV